MGADDWYCEQQMAREEKRHEDAAKWLDQMENALARAETARKDIDLILTMRAVRAMLEREVRRDG